MGVQKNLMRPFKIYFCHMNYLPLFRGLPDPQVAQLVNPHNSVNSSGENPARSNKYFLPTNVFQLHRWWQHKAIIIPRRGVLFLIIGSVFSVLGTEFSTKLTRELIARSVAAPHKCLLIAITF